MATANLPPNTTSDQPDPHPPWVAQASEILEKFEDLLALLSGDWDGDGAEEVLAREIRAALANAAARTEDEAMTALSAARTALITANAEALRALDEARAEVAGGRETRVTRDLLLATIRLQSASTHVTAMVLALAGESAGKG